MRIGLFGILFLLGYLGIGALFHAVLVGDTLAWDSAWTWGLLVGWPALVIAVATAGSILVAIVVFICATLGWLE